ncbi:glucosaminidase domain-containing protein [Paenibacillus sp. yr247]|uniref:glucosaminidase domain-containing protein n=1 Tax=Paenibacillus sp. yr247 TaxID=1761880 RepID=UPI000B8395D2|nr:glucosaminidase domain-containing protein [Paenibacillus sp. yr247]
MQDFFRGDLSSAAKGIGNVISRKLKGAAKNALKKIAKKALKAIGKLILKLLVKIGLYFVTSLGLPLIVCLIAGGGLIFAAYELGWFGSADDTAKINKEYDEAIIETTPDELAQYRPPKLVIQAIDNMRITLKNLDLTDIDPKIADLLKPDFTYKTFYDEHRSTTSHTHKDGTTDSSESSYNTPRKLLVHVHTWNRDIDITYHQKVVSGGHSDSYGDGESSFYSYTDITWEQDEGCVMTSVPSSGGSGVVLSGSGNLTNPFFNTFGPDALSNEIQSGIPAAITLAQAALESGYGKSAPGYNFFGIKADSSWTGATQLLWTTEEIGGVRVPVQALFRAYPSAQASFLDHSKFLLMNGRYQIALQKKNPYEFANELQAAGYATDNQYSNKLKQIIHDYNLAALFDRDKGIDASTGQLYPDVGFVGGTSFCGTPNFSKFDGAMTKFGFTASDAEIVFEALNNHDSSLLAGYNGLFLGAFSNTGAGSVPTNFPPSNQTTGDGTMIWPTATNLTITSGFGARTDPVTGKAGAFHEGFDIAPNHGDPNDYPIYDIKDGTVDEAGCSNDGYGCKVVISHGGGLQTLYGHLKDGSIQVHKGDSVKQGKVIALMGSTGKSTARHLHISVIVNGAYVNPAQFLTPNH